MRVIVDNELNLLWKVLHQFVKIRDNVTGNYIAKLTLGEIINVYEQHHGSNYRSFVFQKKIKTTIDILGIERPLTLWCKDINLWDYDLCERFIYSNYGHCIDEGYLRSDDPLMTQ
jgi:hypothetical protein